MSAQDNVVTMPSKVLEMKGIVKKFPGVIALKNVSFSAERGEVHGLVGENGAGKSTLMKVLSGVHPHPTYEGELVIKGDSCRFSGTREAEEKASPSSTRNSISYPNSPWAKTFSSAASR